MSQLPLGLTLIAAGLLVHGSGCRGSSKGSDAPYRQVRIAGLPAQVRVDPNSGKIAWRALTCMSPACPAGGHEGEPFLFANVTAGATIGEHGEVAAPTPQSADYEIPLPQCPVCGASGEAVVPYDPPDLRLRMMNLQTELENARRLRSEAEPTGAAPGGIRTPAEIMQEMSELPRVYLISH